MSFNAGEGRAAMWIAIVMKPMADVDTIRSFETLTEAEQFGSEETGYGPLDPERDDPDHWQKYDPPIVILLEATAEDALETGKYERPVAVYQRGMKFRCIPD
jgi:hypothetical protein